MRLTYCSTILLLQEHYWQRINCDFQGSGSAQSKPPLWNETRAVLDRLSDSAVRGSLGFPDNPAGMDRTSLFLLQVVYQAIGIYLRLIQWFPEEQGHAVEGIKALKDLLLQLSQRWRLAGSSFYIFLFSETTKKLTKLMDGSDLSYNY
jgi:hypothetical protein